VYPQVQWEHACLSGRQGVDYWLRKIFLQQNTSIVFNHESGVDSFSLAGLSESCRLLTQIPKSQNQQFVISVLQKMSNMQIAIHSL